MRGDSDLTVEDFVVACRIEAEDLKLRKSYFLVARGWIQTCSVPGSVWLFQKRLPDGRVVLCVDDLALRIEAGIPKEGGGDADDS